MTVPSGGRLIVMVLVRRFLHRLVLRPDAVGQRFLLTANPIQAIDDLGALLGQIRERRGKRAQKLGVRIGAGLRFEVGDRSLHISNGNTPLRHLRLQIHDVAFIAPVLGIQIELRPGPDRGERKSWRLDLLAGPVRIRLSLVLSDRRRGQRGHDRDHKNGAGRWMHLRFLSRPMIRSRLWPIKPLKFTVAPLVTPLSLGKRAS